MATTPSAQPLTDDGKFAQKLTPDQRVELMELVVTQSLSYRQAATLWSNRHPDATVSRATVGNIVREELGKVAETRDHVVAEFRQAQDLQIDALIRIALPIALGSKCTVCAGEKVIRRDRLDPDSDMQTCPKCDGSGRNESDSVRLSAIGQVRSLLERRAKLLGLDRPEQLQVAGAFAIGDASKMEGKELASAIEDFFKPGAVGEDRVLREITAGDVGSADREGALQGEVVADVPLEHAAKLLDDAEKELRNGPPLA